MTKAFSPLDMTSKLDTDRVDNIVCGFNEKLLKENPDQDYYHVILSGEFPRNILDAVQEEFVEAGWHNVVCRTSSENGERRGLTSLRLNRFPQTPKKLF